MTHAADRLAFDRAMVAQPVWNRFDTARDAVGLAENVLLHAGPAFTDPAAITTPVLNSARVAAVYEGVARDFDQAREMIRAGEIILQPAQDHGIVVPLAAVISASMPLHSVYDAWRGRIRCLAPINGGPRPSLRLGLCHMAVLDHIRWLNSDVRDALEDGIGEGIGLVAMAADGLRAGDDCHGYTPAAGAALVREIHARSRKPMPGDVSAFLASAPSLFLNLWMAATKVMMRASEKTPGSGLIVAAGGNGQEVGIQVAGLPGQWFTAPAEPPKGNLGDHPTERALGAIGDSAIVDCFGLGAMAFAHSPDQRQAMADFLPPGFRELPDTICTGRHPNFRGLDQKFGCSVRDVLRSEKGPLISLGIIDKGGQYGRLGGGIYDLSFQLCQKAALALKEHSATPDSSQQ